MVSARIEPRRGECWKAECASLGVDVCVCVWSIRGTCVVSGGLGDFFFLRRMLVHKEPHGVTSTGGCTDSFLAPTVVKVALSAHDFI